MRARAFVSVVIEAEINKFRNAHCEHIDYPPHNKDSEGRAQPTIPAALPKPKAARELLILLMTH
jgi:hypothetical protein